MSLLSRMLASPYKHTVDGIGSLHSGSLAFTSKESTVNGRSSRHSCDLRRYECSRSPSCHLLALAQSTMVNHGVFCVHHPIISLGFPNYIVGLSTPTGSGGTNQTCFDPCPLVATWKSLTVYGCGGLGIALEGRSDALYIDRHV